MTAPNPESQRAAYEGLLNAAKKNWKTDDRVPDEVAEAATQGVLKAIRLLTGAPMKTALRNRITGAVATRSLDPEGIPLWQVSDPESGRTWDEHDNVLTPKEDWYCIYDPKEESE